MTEDVRHFLTGACMEIGIKPNLIPKILGAIAVILGEPHDLYTAFYLKKIIRRAAIRNRWRVPSASS